MQGLFGIYSDKDCVQDLFLGTFGLQHRGQHRSQVYCGLATTDGENIEIRTHPGLVAPTFENDLKGMDGYAGIGVTSSIDRQPRRFFSRREPFVVGVDGYIRHSEELRDELYFNGNFFNTEEDAELIAGLIAKKFNYGEGIRCVLDRVDGPCSLVLLCSEGIYGARDLHGMKPLTIGKRDGAWALASSDCAFNNDSGFTALRDVRPGEIVFIGSEGLKVVSNQSTPHPLKQCSFEWMHFEDPDSTLANIPVTRVRHKLGGNLAMNDVAEGFDFTWNDTVVGSVRSSGIIYAEGYHLESRLPSVELFKPLKFFLGTNNLSPSERKRQKSQKMAPIRENIQGRRVILVDSYIRSGITITGIVKMLFDCDAVEVHVRIACPKILQYCANDNPQPEEEQFIAVTKSTDEICKSIGATSLRFQKLDDVPEAFGLPAETLCLNCCMPSFL